MGNSRSSDTHVEHQEERNAGSKHRAEAKRHAQERGQLFEESKAAYARGDGAKAKTLSNQAKAKTRLIEEANRKAKAAIYKENNDNKGRPKTTVDLHGLHVEEAMEVAEEKIQWMKKEDIEQMVFIVGRGNHSEAGIAKIKPAIVQLMHKYDVECFENRPNAGCVTVRKKIRPQEDNRSQSSCTIL